MKRMIPALLLLSTCLVNTLRSKAQAALGNEIQVIVNQLAIKINNKPGIDNIAVADFTNVSGTPTELGKFLSDQFLYSLANMKGSFSVIDRSRVNALLKEVGLYAKGLLDPEAQTRLGRLKGIDVIIVVTLVPDGNSILVTVKAIRLESAAIVGVAQGQISSTPAIRELEEKESAPADSPAGAAGPSPGSTVKTPVHVTAQLNNISAEILGCKQSGQSIECLMTITSKGKDADLFIQLNTSRMIDASNGYEFKVSQLRVADVYASGGGYVQKSLVADYPVTASCTFSPITHRVEKISKLELSLGDFSRLSFRNISVQQ